MALTSESYVVRSPGGPITLETVHYDQIGEHELFVETVAVSVCATDPKAAEGKFYMKPPMILGHEGAGIVKQVGAKVTKFKPGDKVVLHYASCGSCSMCSTGQNPYCDTMLHLNFCGTRVGDGDSGHQDARVATAAEDGTPLNSYFFGQSSMGRHALVREGSAVKVDATDEELRLFAALSCGMQTGAGSVLNVCKPSPGASFAIFGAGAVGLAAALAAGLSTPSRVFVVDTSQEKLDLIPAGIATDTICSKGLEKGAVAEQIRRMTDGQGVDYAIDCAGHGDVIVEGCSALKNRGTVLGVGGGDIRAPLNPSELLAKGLTYKGTHQGDSVSHNFIPYLIRLWRAGKFPFDKLVSYYKIEELSQVLSDLKDSKIIKPVLVSQ